MIGRIIINTGEGKGKTTAALGLVVRAVGQGFKVGVYQFIKGKIATGESEILPRLGVDIFPLGSDFTWNKDSLEEDRRLAQQGWRQIRQAILEDRYDMVVLDEINYALGYGLLDSAQVMEVLTVRPKHMHLVLTGRGLLPELASLADTITEMKMVKHPYRQGRSPALKGIEF